MSVTLVPKGPAEAVWEVQKSRFLALASPVNSAEEARALLKELKGRYADAAHVVHAFCVGRENSQTTGYSDDGEPPGTAGRPVMEVLKGSGVTGVLIAVVRWFGGIKLGTGGLVKAYTESAKRLFEVLEVEPDIPKVRVELVLEYPVYEGFLRCLAEVEGAVISESFLDRVTIQVEFLAEHENRLRDGLRDLSRGRSVWPVRP